MFDRRPAVAINNPNVGECNGLCTGEWA